MQQWTVTVWMGGLLLHSLQHAVRSGRNMPTPPAITITTICTHISTVHRCQGSTVVLTWKLVTTITIINLMRSLPDQHRTQQMVHALEPAPAQPLQAHSHSIIITIITQLILHIIITIHRALTQFPLRRLSRRSSSTSSPFSIKLRGAPGNILDLNCMKHSPFHHRRASLSTTNS